MSDIAKASLPQWCIDIIANPPRTGEGFHNWLFRAARALWKCGRSENDIRPFLENAAATCGRHIPNREIEQAIKNSQTNAFQINPANQCRPRSAFNPEKRKSAIGEGYSLSDLWESSPLRLEDNAVHTETIIDRLFPGDPLLCVGKSTSEFDTRTREQWRGDLWKMQLIVPSPMTGRIGPTQEGKESAHALSITGPRRFLVIEQDRGTLDEQAAVLLHLMVEQHAPMAIAVHSGSKSIHGWFFCAGRSEELLRRFFEYAVEIGADPALWTRSQFVRMPDGRRDNSKRQRVYFFNPEAVK
jgi:hypothetical protein